VQDAPTADYVPKVIIPEVGAMAAAAIAEGATQCWLAVHAHARQGCVTVMVPVASANSRDEPSIFETPHRWPPTRHFRYHRIH
jgi:hypothetical protein